MVRTFKKTHVKSEADRIWEPQGSFFFQNTEETILFSNKIELLNYENENVSLENIFPN